MKWLAYGFGVLLIWIIIGFIWNHFHPLEEEEEYDDSPYD